MSVFCTHICGAAALTALLVAPTAFAHVSLQTKEAPVASSYKAVFTVPHGCQGSPTIKLRVRIPEGVIAVKPQPKAGWSLETVKGEYQQSHTRFGAQVSSGVQEVIWSGGRLLDEHYDEFVFIGYLSNALQPGSTLHFPVVQECEQGVARWIDIPEAGKQSADDHSDSPAPGLKLLPRK